MMYKDELGKYCSTNGGFVSCDGITIDNVYGFYIDFCDDEIVLENKHHKTVGGIGMLSYRKHCIFTEYGDKSNVLNFKDYTIIIDGEVNEHIC